VALIVVVVAGWSSDETSLATLTPLDAGIPEVLRSAGFLFFAFAGYARIATLGEEVVDPEVTIPRAITRALTFVLIVYAIVGVTALASTPVDVLAGSDAPLKAVVDGSPLDALAPVVEIGAAIASLGVLLNLIPGVSRTTLAMARRAELPEWLAHVDGRRNQPLRAELTVAGVVLLLVLVVGLHSAIALSGVAVLTYYAITNAAAFTLPPEERRWPRWICVVGAVGCLALAVFLPFEVVLVGTAVLLLGVVIRRVTS
jgi:APA family basic amino acid/polyamine antiporter